jgi:uncharacterized small protein (DUF1192 family)
MRDDDELPARPTRDLVVPARLDGMSVDEMTSLRDRLRKEIARLEDEIAKRSDVRRAAEALFKKPGS